MKPRTGNQQKKSLCCLFVTRQLLPIVFLLLSLPLWSAEKVTVTGEVTDKGSGNVLVGANVLLEGTTWGTSTDEEGRFVLEIPAGSYRLVVQYIGYNVFSKTLEIQKDMPPMKVSLKEAPIELSQVVVTATRTPTPVKDIPANVTVLSSSTIENQGGMNLDDILASEPGIDVRRASGIFTMSPELVIRGTGGNEPSRTLVMIDGVPINKSDTGESNWNRIKAETVERVEIVRGPASALYGSSAMGGVINLITKAPEEGIHAKVRLQGGSLGTAGGDLSISGGKILGDQEFLGFVLSGNYLKSDGYIAEPEADRTEYTVKSFLNENSQSAKLMYINGSHEITATYQRYDDRRGEGEKIQMADGVCRDFDTDFFNLQYKGGSGRWHWETKGFYQLEKYARIVEAIKKGNYQHYDVLSDRKDMGFLSSASYAGKLGLLSFGVDVKQGSVDGADTYRTSPDIVANKGTSTMVSGFVQDEISFFQDKLNVVAGLRLDQVTFDQGEINSTMSPWDTYNGDLNSHTWKEISPRLGVSYQIRTDTRLYASVGQAFRGSILDDLCRSGWMWVGPKIANPYLEPETMTNTELGLQQSVGKVLFKLTGYYAIGNDFLYYVTTGDSVSGRALWQRQNVGGVEMKGIEASVQAPLNQFLDVSAGLTISQSIIDEFPERTDLEGNSLTYSPEQKGKISLGFHYFVDGSLTWEWVGKQYTDDQNMDEISSYNTLHLNVTKNIVNGLRVGLMVRNVLDTQYLQSETSLDPGRMILGSLTYAY